MRLMIVDDSSRIREMERAVLAELFHDFIECSNGLEAVRLYSLYHPDWVLMDIKMKVMNGISATKQIVQTDPAAKIIIVTNYNDPGMMEEAKLAGATKYILKENITTITGIIGDFLKTFEHNDHKLGE